MKKKMNVCILCGKDFSALNAFDKHFTGDRKIYSGANRFRCKTDNELLNENFRIGFDGRWTNSKEMSQEEKERARSSKNMKITVLP